MKIVQISAIWCSSCLAMQKEWNKVQKEFPHLQWSVYDLDFNPEVKRYQVGEKLPVLILEEQGVEKSRLVGEKRSEEVILWIKQNMD